ncbi:hypothetical protein HN784_00510 [bacterium]|jgi:hypothetical protein|nr:hypothetical protein [bacterium]MBT4251562.1 hypothetical protein [bacterium]MBT4597611.1 hypothetical protein [bacterium]MBT6753625.1 hypothetical protein [bacterium]MBT7037762.1 hypothetical protein [bacterium]
MTLQGKSSIVVRLKNDQESVTIEEVFHDLNKQGIFNLNLLAGAIYQGSRFVSSLGANLFVIANEFAGIQEAALKLPYFEEIVL